MSTPTRTASVILPANGRYARARRAPLLFVLDDDAPRSRGSGRCIISPARPLPAPPLRPALGVMTCSFNSRPFESGVWSLESGVRLTLQILLTPDFPSVLLLSKAQLRIRVR